MAFVNSTEEVSNIAFICNEEECPIVAWGTGTSLEEMLWPIEVEFL